MPEPSRLVERSLDGLDGVEQQVGEDHLQLHIVAEQDAALLQSLLGVSPTYSHIIPKAACF